MEIEICFCPSLENSFEKGLFLNSRRNGESTFLARIKSNGKQIYENLDHYKADYAKVSNLLVQNYRNILISFFSFDSALLILFCCSSLLRSLRWKRLLRKIKIHKELLFARLTVAKRNVLERMKRQKICQGLYHRTRLYYRWR